jgi:hypothetical protein
VEPPFVFEAGYDDDQSIEISRFPVEDNLVVRKRSLIPAANVMPQRGHPVRE